MEIGLKWANRLRSMNLKAAWISSSVNSDGGSSKALIFLSFLGGTSSTATCGIVLISFLFTSSLASSYSSSESKIFNQIKRNSPKTIVTFLWRKNSANGIVEGVNFWATLRVSDATHTRKSQINVDISHLHNTPVWALLLQWSPECVLPTSKNS